MKPRDELLRLTQKLRAELTALEALIWELYAETKAPQQEAETKTPQETKEEGQQALEGN